MNHENAKFGSRLVIGMVVLITGLASVWEAKAKAVVELPAGSIDSLANAVLEAGPGGTVLVKSGKHIESGTVPITSRVAIVGEPGAVLVCGTTPGVVFPLPVTPTIHVKATEKVLIQGLEFQPSGAAANCALLIDHSAHVTVIGNLINGFQFGVMVEFGDQAVIRGNTVASTAAVGITMGIVVVNGKSPSISDNAVSGSVFGIFESDLDGSAGHNTASNCYVGFILCHIAAGMLDILGDTSGAHTRCISWHSEGNLATSNAWGFQIVDGSHDNVLVNNDAANNSEYDIELAGDTGRYAPFPASAPACYENLVVVGHAKGLVLKDCGLITPSSVRLMVLITPWIPASEITEVALVAIRPPSQEMGGPRPCRF